MPYLISGESPVYQYSLPAYATEKINCAFSEAKDGNQEIVWEGFVASYIVSVEDKILDFGNLGISESDERRISYL